MLRAVRDRDPMTLDEALRLIGDAFGNFDRTLSDGLPDGDDSDWGYDEQLVKEIAEAVVRWNARS